MVATDDSKLPGSADAWTTHRAAAPIPVAIGSAREIH